MAAPHPGYSGAIYRTSNEVIMFIRSTMINKHNLRCGCVYCIGHRWHEACGRMPKATMKDGRPKHVSSASTSPKTETITLNKRKGRVHVHEIWGPYCVYANHVCHT